MILARENPLRSECVERIPFQPLGWTWEDLDQRLENSNFRGAIVGPEGTGKTTLLEELAVRLRHRAQPTLRWKLDAGNPLLPIDAARTLIKHQNSIVLLDGAEQLRPRDWRRFLAATQSMPGLIITSHRAGLLPTLAECRTSVELLDRLLLQLLPTETVESLGPLPGQLFHELRGNVRLVLRALYDHLAECA